MSPEENKYYENYLDLFVHPGWKQFVTEAQELLDSFSIDEIKDTDQLFLVKGQRLSLLNIVRFETGIRNALDMESDND